MNDFPPLSVQVWGDFACFTRPEMKVERVSYEVMTPSAARGILEAIFWKPEFHWRVRQIEVLKPIRRLSIKRNEVKSKASYSTIKGWNESGDRYFGDEDRTQRHSLILKDVSYIIRADVKIANHAQDENPAKFRDQFRRRVNRGQCFHRPYLGCREFGAHFGKPNGKTSPINLSEDLGRMVFDINYEQERSGRGKPVFFQARLENGILEVPNKLYDEIGRDNGVTSKT